MFSHSLDIILFDVKLNSPYKNLILLKGNEYEIETVPLIGRVKLSLNEDAYVRAIHLSLIGEFHYDFLRMDKLGYVCDRKFDHVCVLNVDWANLLTSEQGDIIFGTYGDTTMPFNKLKSRKQDGLSRTLSNRSSVSNVELNIPESGLDGTPFKGIDPASLHSNRFLLPKGNYSLPFSVYLPTNVAETVEGLSVASIQYRLHCEIERGRFEKNHSTSKYLRIVRTLHPQNFNLCDTLEVNNTWPNKVEYSVKAHKKGIAIGSTIPIDILIIPMLKGLSLKGIKCSIVQHYHVKLDDIRSPEFEKIIGSTDLAVPNMDDLEYEKWSFKTYYKVPEQLKILTQSCDCKNSMIVVKHRLKLVIQIRNPEGHVSELRINLPIFVYISANAGRVVGRHFTIDEPYGTFHPCDSTEDVLFKHPEHPSLSSSARSPPSSTETDNEDEIDDVDLASLDRQEEAPPLYQEHVYDEVFDADNPPQSPLIRIHSPGNSPSLMNTTNSSCEDLSSDNDYPISMVSSMESAFGDGMVPARTINSLDLSRVPTYQEAIEEDYIEDNLPDVFAPIYPGNPRDDALSKIQSAPVENNNARGRSLFRGGKDKPRSASETRDGYDVKRNGSGIFGRLFHFGKSKKKVAS
ncbi:uncharacterized protein J8A68_003500 [[Candida] subhashii]|uniref:Arrestin C-terminal-like domain-containing protein n=1 Tax=[Candida] subhashii TaxID=561895 RepID=A0A8J5UWJ1_9ASCO|nr:uncharacterized protein J8A68_003500 [[Candida] subhashii]KAG7662990.1 hypothetical protein J8A68_003500 [[Candida] subhashii]